MIKDFHFFEKTYILNSVILRKYETKVARRYGKIFKNIKRLSSFFLGGGKPTSQKNETTQL